MRITLLTALSIALFLSGCLSAEAGPLLPGLSYQAIARCNDDSYTFFETYQNGASQSPHQGVLAVKGTDGNVMGLQAISEIDGTPSSGISFSVSGLSAISLSPQGEGSFTHQTCSQAAGAVTCHTETIDLKCEFVPIVPSGVSAGN